LRCPPLTVPSRTRVTRAPGAENLLDGGLYPLARDVTRDAGHQQGVVIGVWWRTDASTASVIAFSSSDLPAAERPTRPLPLRAVCRATSIDESGRRRQIRLAAAASVVGTSIEWYDFFLYGTAAAIVFPAVFFPKSGAYSGTLESFATYAVGFAARPVGAAIFGHWGDRLGRKATLIVTLLIMGVASALVYGSAATLCLGTAQPIQRMSKMRSARRPRRP
jgi:hypothetical protein